MALPALPPETALGGSERLIGQWDFSLEMRQSPVARILTRFLLTSERLMVLQLPTGRVASGLAGRLWLRKPPSRFMQDMGRWHVMLDSTLKELPEPMLGRIDYSHPTALPSNKTLILGPKNFPVGEAPSEELMCAEVRAQWAAVRVPQAGPLR